MNSSDQAPRIPLWVFFTTDFALLAAAAFIAANSPRPLGSDAILGIVACVIVGGCVAFIPLIMWFERKKNETLDDRQRALEALATTVSNSAEQIGIATAGLQDISDVVQKNLRHAEQLPHRLQEKMAEFQAQLANATDGEKEELEKEVAALRETETEKLETLTDRLTRAVAEFAKLEASTHQHLAAASEAAGKLSLGTASAIGKAQAAAEQALGQARIEAARHLGESAGQHARSFEAAKTAALSELDSRIAAAGNALADRLARDIAAALAPAIASLESKIARLEAAAQPDGPGRGSPPHAAESAPPSETAAAPERVGTAAPDAPPAPAAVPPGESPPAAAAARDEHSAAAPKRARKPHRDEITTESTHAPANDAKTPLPAKPEPEPAPVLRHTIPEVSPVAPDTAEPFSLTSEPETYDTRNGSGTKARPTPPADKRSANKPVQATSSPHADRSGNSVAAAGEPAAAAPTGESGPSEVLERVLSSDGATRLIVTAYIGIGNRLFIRGDGAGLTWEKGVPLQFVSIGKWRWETNDATRPIRFKLLKNDEHECPGLGAQTLDPGHQQEVTASF